MGSPTYRRRGRSIPCQACHVDALRMEEERKKTQPCNKKNGPHIFLPKGVLNKGDGTSTGHQRKISISIWWKRGKLRLQFSHTFVTLHFLKAKMCVNSYQLNSKNTGPVLLSSSLLLQITRMDMDWNPGGYLTNWEGVQGRWEFETLSLFRTKKSLEKYKTLNFITLFRKKDTYTV